MTLADLSPGESRIVDGITVEGDGSLARRFMELGFTEGVRVELVRVAPWFGCPIAVRVRGGLYAIRKQDARQIRLRNE